MLNNFGFAFILIALLFAIISGSVISRCVRSRQRAQAAVQMAWGPVWDEHKTKPNLYEVCISDVTGQDAVGGVVTWASMQPLSAQHSGAVDHVLATKTPSTPSQSTGSLSLLPVPVGRALQISFIISMPCTPMNTTRRPIHRTLDDTVTAAAASRDATEYDIGTCILRTDTRFG